MGHWLNLAERLANRQYVASESIRFQQRDKFEKLTAAVAEFRKNNYSRTAYETSTIPEVIMDCFGVNVRLCDGGELGMADTRLAAVHPPELDKNHPLVPEFQRMVYKGNNDLAIYSKFAKDGVIIGEVSDADARISGDYSKIVCQLYVTPVLFSDPEFTDEELAAIILHEVGHIYTYFKLIGRTLLTNMIADAAANRLMKTEDPKEKMKIVSDVEKLLNTKINQPDTLLVEYRKEALYMHLVTDLSQPRINAVASNGYANRNWERLADDFAARCGAGQYLASGLFKLESSPMYLARNSAFIDYGTHIVTQVALLGFVIYNAAYMPFVTAGLCVLGLVISDPQNYIYDQPQERFETLRRTMMQELRVYEGVNSKEANEYRKRILKEVGVVDNLLSEVKDKDNVFKLFHDYLTPSGRREKRAIEFQQDIERFLTSDLALASARLSTAATK
ncbi:putative virion structural protein [Erwinia phage vB_EamM_Phobos]|uniref:putative virion structural protein n=1 Tax=Erwinia phage vB_EamM_Phobos TaxID=1883377 RepID=UPI00081CBDA4|nr:putative virion structural protein [Erwinia phage vB_EamM_Phobos]ANZ50238.1 putative virion structural protein [Erwinia phage vB_EamM_Phobos]